MIPAGRVESADLTVGPEPAPTVFQLLDASDRFVEQRPSTAHDDHVRVGAHRSKTSFNWHAMRSWVVSSGADSRRSAVGREARARQPGPIAEGARRLREW